MENNKIEVSKHKLQLLINENKHQRELLKKVVLSFEKLMMLLDLNKGINQSTLLLKLPKIIHKVQQNPDLFNILDESFINELKKYSDEHPKG